jgi:hypothetical protein
MTRNSPGIITALLALTVCACGGGGGGSGSSLQPPPPNASPGGIWQGSDPVSGLALFGMVTESGTFNFIRADGVQYYGTLTTSQNNLSGTFTGITPAGTTFTDGSTHGTGTVSGTIQARATISATLTFMTANGASSGGTGSLTFNTLYNSGSSLATVAGNYADTLNNTVISVDANGALFDQDPTSGCVINGQVSIIDTRYDLYQIQYSFANCTGSSTFLNGTTATGLSAQDTTVNPIVSYSAVVDSTASYSIVGTFNKE